MHKQTIILIVILAIVTGILVFLAVTNQNILNNQPKGTLPTGMVAAKTAKVFFNPSAVDATSAAAFGSEIMVDTGGAKIAGVQTELQYDPKAIANVKIMPAADATGFFGPGATILFNDVKPDTGRVSYVIAISPGEEGKAGVGKIGTLSFTRVPGGPATTTINFVDKTLVTVLNGNDSALKETTPLTINFTSATPARTTVPLVSPSVFVQPTTPAQ